MQPIYLLEVTSTDFMFPLYLFEEVFCTIFSLKTWGKEKAFNKEFDILKMSLCEETWGKEKGAKNVPEQCKFIPFDRSNKKKQINWWM